MNLLQISVFAAITLAVLLLWWWNHRQAQSLATHYPTKVEAFDAKVKVHTAMGQIFASFVLLLGFMLTWQQQADTNRRLETTEQSSLQADVTGRYNRAIELLGHETRVVRLSGVYSLQQVAREDPSRFRTPARAILCSFVREQATKGNLAVAKEASSPWPPTDVAGALVVLSGMAEEDYRLAPETEKNGRDLSGVSEMDLRGVSLSGADLQNMFLVKARLQGADLRACDLRYSFLQAADLSDTNLEGALLSGANLSDALMKRCNMNGARLAATILRGADVRDAQLLVQDGTLAASQLQDARGNSGTALPSYLTAPDVWEK